MTRNIDIRVEPRTAAIYDELLKYLSKELKVSSERIKKVDILRRSIDARQRRVFVNLSVCAHIDAVEPSEPVEIPEYPVLQDDAASAIVVGAGPAGLFAALRLIELGVKPVILERGKDVDSRRKDLAAIARQDAVDPDSNYSFGEGGAGAYSDGKLYTRSKKRGNVRKILNILHQHGAPRDILVDAHPHIGTNLLPDIIKNIRKTIQHCGGQVYFNKRVTGLVVDSESGEVKGVTTANGEQFNGPVILATGHSARDTYEYLDSNGIALEPKGIAVGVRLEHPAQLIDRLQYHSPEGRGKYLPAAEYSMLTRVDNRAVYSFCMCPGGVVVPAATSPGQLVVNGMSSSNRGSRWSNSGMVVEVLPEDIPGDDKMRVMRFQQDIERNFFEDGGSQNAPAQRMADFVAAKPSRDLPPVSYAPGVHAARIDKLLPPMVSQRLRKAFRIFDSKQPGFLTNDAVLIGAETRTSAPLRIPRDPVSMQHIEHPGLFPAGEGAGYAGGIVSAAIDGEKCADAVAAVLT